MRIFIFVLLSFFSAFAFADPSFLSHCSGKNVCTINVAKFKALLNENVSQAKKTSTKKDKKPPNQQTAFTVPLVLNKANHYTTTVRIPSNPGSTGYMWMLGQYDSTLLTVLQRFVPANSKLIGAPGHQVFTFIATQNAIADVKTANIVMTATVELVYRRPWVAGKAQAQISASDRRVVTVRIG